MSKTECRVLDNQSTLQQRIKCIGCAEMRKCRGRFDRNQKYLVGPFKVLVTKKWEGIALGIALGTNFPVGANLQ